MQYTIGDKEYTLRPWQAECVRTSRDRDKLLLCVGTGLGKTLTSLILAEKYSGKLLVICIKKKKADWIRDTVHRDTIVMTRDDIYTKPIPDDVSVIIIDELHMVVSNTTSKRFDVLYNYIKDIPARTPIICLSATPIRTWQSLFSYYCIFGESTPEDFPRWQKRFQYIGEQWAKSKAGKAFKKRVYKDRNDTVTQEYIEKGLRKISYIYFEDNPNATETEIIVPITLNFPITENQPTSHDFYRLENKHPAKVHRLLELIEDWTVVVCYYREEVEWLKELLGCRAVSGNDEYDEEMKLEKVLVLQGDSATGYELPNHKRMIFYSYSYTYINFVQAKGRIDRGDMPHVEYIYLEAKYSDCREPTMDNKVRKSLKNKSNFDPATWHNDYVRTEI